MLVGLAVFVLLALVFVAGVAADRQRRALDARRADTATRLGLTYRPAPLGVPTITGTLGGHPLEIEFRVQTIPAGKATISKRFTIYRLSALPISLEVKPNGWTSKLKGAVLGPGFESGDARFDRALAVRGELADTILTVAPDVAGALGRLVDLGGTIDDGTLSLSLPGHDAPEVVEQRVAELSGLARALRDARAAEPRLLLAHFERGTESAGRSLRALVARFPASAEAKTALDAARSAPSAELRVVHAIATADSARALTLALDPGTPPPIRTIALEWLATAPALPLDDAAEDALLSALDRGDARDARAVISTLGAGGTTRAVLALTRHAERLLGDGEVKAAAEAAIAAIQRRVPEAEAGRLSLAEERRGELTLARREGGELSLTSKSA